MAIALLVLLVPGGAGIVGQAIALPDLVVKAVDTSGVSTDLQTLVVSGTVDATVKNVGDAAAAVDFTVVAFEDLNGNGTFESGTDLVLGQTLVAAPLNAGQESVASISVSGVVSFAGNLIYAFVDSEDTIAESDEDNNLANSGVECQVDPPVGAFDPVLEWSWTSSPVQGSALNVMMTPAVIDLNGDLVPDVVFASTSSTGGGQVEVGFLRALNGDDGSEIFTVTDPSFRVNTASSVAAGDIDLDGSPEILACDSTGRRLIAFEHDGTFKWRSPTLEVINWGAPAIADLDGDGRPEIVIGRQVLDNSGAILWTGTGGRASQGTVGPISLVADLDLDGSPEVVAGNTAYTSSGAIMWQAPLPDGHNAVADFDDDPFPEIVLVAGGTVRLLEHTGVVKWGPVSIPGGGAGGPPTVADYDADGEVEVGVAGASRYAVFETDGSLKWAAVTQDGSSNRTGSSVFDFDGDDSAEVVYRDELRLRVYRGTDGAVLFSVPMSSCTWHEYVLVADVDADGNAEIVAVANNNCGFGPQRGVFVYGSASDSWVATRRMWNQHAYHITNINDDGSIPAVEENNWLFPAAKPFNNYRQNLLGELAPTSSPDLTASFLQCTDIPSASYVIARIGNGGAVQVGAGVDVSFYDGDPSGGGVLLGTAATSSILAPGQFEDVALALPGGFDFSADIFVVADDSGGLVGSESECDETNNIHSIGNCAPFDPLEVTKTAEPTEVDEPGGDITYTVNVINDWPVPVVYDTVLDDKFGDVSGSCSPPIPATLAPGEMISCTFTRAVTGTPSEPHTNVVTVSGTDDDGTVLEDTDDATVIFNPVCVDPAPLSQGYWHRQCLGAGLITPGRNGRGPQEPLEPDFTKTLVPAVDLRLQATVFEFLTCEDGMDAVPPSDPCERALKQYTALLLNIASDRVQDSCTIDPAALACGAANIAELVDELAALYNSGDPASCRLAADCAAAINENQGIQPTAAPLAGPDLATLSGPVGGGTAQLKPTSGVDAPRIAASGGGSTVSRTAATRPTRTERVAEPSTDDGPAVLLVPDVSPAAASSEVSEMEADRGAQQIMSEALDAASMIERHLAVLTNASVPERARAISEDALLTALGGGYEPDVRLRIIRALLRNVDVAYQSLLAKHLEDIRIEAEETGNKKVSRDAARLLKNLEQIRASAK
jgi:hypothetical protein